jgi:hypothetical protein
MLLLFWDCKRLRSIWIAVEMIVLSAVLTMALQTPQHWAGTLSMPRGIASAVPMNLTVSLHGKSPLRAVSVCASLCVLRMSGTGDKPLM